jgi:diphthine-ammonia ligase
MPLSGLRVSRPDEVSVGECARFRVLYLSPVNHFTMSQLKVVALISGGKDSFFSMLHCLANEHYVVALANLYPSPLPDGQAVEDSDSFMYQTIGHSVIPLYEQALGIPLYREQILGSAIEHNRSYGPYAAGNAGVPDETESLIALLGKVMSAHPQLNAVSTGAIMSDYQRTRVESVALRLGLIPLSYLWQYPTLPQSTDTALLEDMAMVGQDARIIKVASGGLDDSFLWMNVADAKTQTRLAKASKRFGTPGDGSELGEGGEYETLAIAGPPPLWRSRIAVDDSDRQNIPGEAGSAFVRVMNARLEPLQYVEPARVRIPELFDERFQHVKRTIEDAEEGSRGGTPDSAASNSNAEDASNNVLLIDGVSGLGRDAAEQTIATMARMEARLQAAGQSFKSVAYTSIILRDMGDFAAVNAAYAKHFAYATPPSRVTISCEDLLPEGALVMISATSHKSLMSCTRKGLHVQSRSYWAPANIGPYSQAVSVPVGDPYVDSEVVYVAGQIPLVPCSMDLHIPHGLDTEATFVEQAILSLQHLHRIGDAMQVGRWVHVIAFLTADAPQVAISRANIARRVWKAASQYEHRGVSDADTNEDQLDENYDVWNEQRDHSRRPWQHYTPAVSNGPEAHESQCLLLTAIQVDSLPRGASIEWAAYGLSGNTAHTPWVPHYLHLLELFSARIL